MVPIKAAMNFLKKFVIEKIERNTDASIEILTADAGYSTPGNLEKLESREIDAYIPDDTYQGRSRGKAVSPFDRDNFIYNETKDTFTCPTGKTVFFWHTTRSR